MLAKNKIRIILSCFLIQAIFSFSALADEPLLQGEVNSDNINIRSDSTVSSEVICVVNRGEKLDVLSELYDWYKVKLPSFAPSFIKKQFVLLIDGKTGKVTSDSVNIRLRPDTKSPILGKAHRDDPVVILGGSGEWYQISPVIGSVGWISKKLISKLEKKQVETVAQPKEEAQSIIIEGTLKAKVFTRVATHKLITEGKVYLIRGDRQSLDSFNGKRVKITGKLVDPTKQKYPIIALEKIEELN